MKIREYTKRKSLKDNSPSDSNIFYVTVLYKDDLEIFN